ncbi:cytochrome cd1-nitrite reductase-like protein [Hypoxylon sp. FL1284]|nr:cytochrome cd1-nitrite reductase-like protein [Hypoxylon sp. FL1284]
MTTAMLNSLGRWVIAALSIHITAVTAATVAEPACQAAAPHQRTMPVRTALMNIDDSPFGVIYASDDVAFVGAGPKVEMLNMTSFKPTVAREISLPKSLTSSVKADAGGAATGLALSHDKRYLYAAIGSGAAIIDVERAIAGDASPVAGALIGTVGVGAIQVTVAPDDGYVFVTQEYGTNATLNRGAIEVFRMHRAYNGSMHGTNEGYVTLGYGVVGTGLSYDGTKMYVTSEITSQATSANETQGTLSVLDVATLKHNPSKALLRSVDAGCSPVRLALSPDGTRVWVTARMSNKLLAFDAAGLDSGEHLAGALETTVQVGTSPVGLVIVNGGRHIVTADSNRFDYANATTGLTVVDVEAALRGTQSFPRIPTGQFPREFAASLDGKTLLVSQFQSKAIQAIDLTQL